MSDHFSYLMKDYKKFQEKYYEEEWNKLQLSDKPEETGWRTNVPSLDFFDFVKWLKKEKISGKVLDIGCGGGRHTIVLAKEGFEVYGIDFSKSAVKVAQNNARKASVSDKTFFKVGDALNLPYTDDFFNVINDDGCLHHISKDDWKKYLQNVTKVLKKDGILRVKVFSKNCNFYEVNKPKNSDDHWILVPSKDYTYFFDKNEISGLFENDFDMIKIEEKYHSVTKKKKFFFVVLNKK